MCSAATRGRRTTGQANTRPRAQAADASCITSARSVPASPASKHLWLARRQVPGACAPAHGTRNTAHSDVRGVHNAGVVELCRVSCCAKPNQRTHHDVETAKGLDGSVDKRLDIGLLGDVALDGNGLRGGEALLDVGGSLGDGGLVDVRKDDAGALGGELERGLETDAAGCVSGRQGQGQG